MLKEKGILLVGCVSVALLVSLSVAFKGRGEAAQANKQAPPMLGQGTSERTSKRADDDATPIVDFNTSSPMNGARASKNARHNKLHLVSADVEPAVVEVVRERPTGISDIPIDRADLVLEGEVTDSAAFLSTDKRMVYSEFTIRVTDILRTASTAQVNKGDVITAERFGGRVRYPEGRIVRYRYAGQGSPVKGKKYLFFLSLSEETDWKVVTAYEITGNKVFALDGLRTDERGLGRSVFDKHNDEDYQQFRASVQSAINNPRGMGPRRSAP